MFMYMKSIMNSPKAYVLLTMQQAARFDFDNLIDSPEFENYSYKIVNEWGYTHA